MLSSPHPSKPAGPSASPDADLRSARSFSDIWSCSSRSVSVVVPTASPKPAYIAQGPAEHLTSSELDRATTVSEPALDLVNGLLDYTLYTLLNMARSTDLAALKQVVPKLLKQRLGQAAVQAAEDDLRDMADAGVEPDLTTTTTTTTTTPPTPEAPAYQQNQQQQQQQHQPRSFDSELAWKLARLGTMAHVRLGDLEEEDCKYYLEHDGLDEYTNHPVLATASTATFFLTSVIEFVGDQALCLAAQFAERRHTTAIAKLATANGPAPDDSGPVVIGPADMHSLGRDGPLSRLWRSWRRDVRLAESWATTPAPLASPALTDSAHSRKSSAHARSIIPEEDSELSPGLPGRFPVFGQRQVLEPACSPLATRRSRSQPRPGKPGHQTAPSSNADDGSPPSPVSPLTQRSRSPARRNSLRSLSLPPLAKSRNPASSEPVSPISRSAGTSKRDSPPPLPRESTGEPTSSPDTVRQVVPVSPASVGGAEREGGDETEAGHAPPATAGNRDSLRAGIISGAVGAIAGALGIEAMRSAQQARQQKDSTLSGGPQTVAEEMMGPSTAAVAPPANADTGPSINHASDFDDMHIPVMANDDHFDPGRNAASDNHVIENSGRPVDHHSLAKDEGQTSHAATANDDDKQDVQVTNPTTTTTIITASTWTQNKGRGSSALEQPLRGSSALDQPLRSSSALDQPLRSSSALDQPLRGSSALDQPLRSSSALDQPLHHSRQVSDPADTALRRPVSHEQRASTLVASQTAQQARVGAWDGAADDDDDDDREKRTLPSSPASPATVHQQAATNGRRHMLTYYDDDDDDDDDDGNNDDPAHDTDTTVAPTTQAAQALNTLSGKSPRESASQYSQSERNSSSYYSAHQGLVLDERQGAVGSASLVHQQGGAITATSSPAGWAADGSVSRSSRYSQPSRQSQHSPVSQTSSSKRLPPARSPDVALGQQQSQPEPPSLSGRSEGHVAAGVAGVTAATAAAAAAAALALRRQHPALRNHDGESHDVRQPRGEEKKTKKKSLEILINSDETLHYTLTPEQARPQDGQLYSPLSLDRDQGHPRSPNKIKSQTQDLADFFRGAGGPSGGDSVAAKPSSPSFRPSQSKKADRLWQTMPVEQRSATAGAASRSRNPRGIAPRDARPERNTTRDLADHARSTGPTTEAQLPQPLGAASAASGRYLLGSGGRGTRSAGSLQSSYTAKSGGRSHYQARDPRQTREATAELIQLIREGPSSLTASTDPRLARLRIANESEDSHNSNSNSNSNNNTANNLRTSVGSARNSSVLTGRSIQESTNSRTGLLDGAAKSGSGSNGNLRTNGIGTTTAAAGLAKQSIPELDNGMAARKRQAPRDPYAIDDSDDDALDEELAQTPPKQESLIDFLRNTAPPPGMANQPVLATVVSGAGDGAAASSSPPSKLRDLVGRSNSVTYGHGGGGGGSSRSARSPKQANGAGAGAAAAAAAARESSPHLTQVGSKLDKYRPTQTTHAAHVDRNRQRARNGSWSESPAATANTGTSDLAHYLRNTGPPPSSSYGGGSSSIAIPGTKDQGAISRFLKWTGSVKR